jgi:hypothetical protein
MTSTTYLTRYSKAVLEMVCRQKKMTPEELRLGTLKGAQVDLANFLENSNLPIDGDDREVLVDLLMRVRIAIGDE